MKPFSVSGLGVKPLHICAEREEQLVKVFSFQTAKVEILGKWERWGNW